MLHGSFGPALFRLMKDVLRQLIAMNGHKAAEQFFEIVSHHTFFLSKISNGTS